MLLLIFQTNVQKFCTFQNAKKNKLGAEMFQEKHFLTIYTRWLVS